MNGFCQFKSIYTSGFVFLKLPFLLGLSMFSTLSSSLEADSRDSSNSFLILRFLKDSNIELFSVSLLSIFSNWSSIILLLKRASANSRLGFTLDLGCLAVILPVQLGLLTSLSKRLGLLEASYSFISLPRSAGYTLERPPEAHRSQKGKFIYNLYLRAYYSHSGEGIKTILISAYKILEKDYKLFL